MDAFRIAGFSPRDDRGVHKSVKQEAHVVEHPAVWEALPIVERWIRMARAATSPEDHAALQSELAVSAIAVRNIDAELKGARERLVAQLHDLPHSERAELEAQVAHLEIDKAANRRRMTALRSVQDGVIWRLLGYDRAAIATFGLGHQVGYPSQSFERELAKAQECWGKGRIAVFADLSTCLRTGDLLVGDLREGSFAPLEVKSSVRTDRRGRRQQARASARIEFLNASESDVLADGRTVYLAGERACLRTHLGTLRQVMAKAQRTVVAGALVAPHLYVTVFDGRAALSEAEGDPEAALQRITSRHAKLLPPSTWAHDEQVTLSSFSRLQRDETTATATTAPYSIFPFEADTCAALCLGILRYDVTLNMDAVRRFLTRRDWMIGPPVDDTPDIWIAVTQPRPDGAIFHGINNRVLEQLQVELLALGALSDLIATGLAESGRVAPNRGLYAWRWDEAHAWR